MRSFRFEHERLEIYKRARQFCVVAVAARKKLPRGWGSTGDQLHRAATSILLNVAEGAGCFRPSQKARFYRIALGSSSECAAVLDVLRINDPQDRDLAKGRQLLVEVQAMLRALIRRFSGE